jgi:hypothetical protein
MPQYRLKEHLLEPNWVSLLFTATIIASAIAYIATIVVYAKKGIDGVHDNVYDPIGYVGEWVGGPVFLLGLVLALIKRTRKIGGVIIYLNAAIGFIALGILAFVITETLGSKSWAVVGAVVGAASLGYGMFAVSVVVLAIRGQWLFAALFLFGALFLRWVCKAARRLMYHDLIAANNALPFNPAFVDEPESNSTTG